MAFFTTGRSPKPGSVLGVSDRTEGCALKTGEMSVLGVVAFVDGDASRRAACLVSLAIMEDGRRRPCCDFFIWVRLVRFKF